MGNLWTIQNLKHRIVQINHLMLSCFVVRKCRRQPAFLNFGPIFKDNITVIPDNRGVVLYINTVIMENLTAIILIKAYFLFY